MSTAATKTKSTAVALSRPERMAAIKETVAECSPANLAALDPFDRTFTLAAGIQRLRELITDDMLSEILKLMNTSLGFKTDKDPARNPRAGGTYSPAVVKDCLIEATIRGAYPVGNEWNIIASNTYLTKEFYQRAVGQIPGVTDVIPSPGIPRKDADKTVVRFGLSWKLDGKPQMLVDAEGKPGRVFAIKVNEYMGDDAVIGKATRKAYKAAYDQITGSDSGPDGDLDDAIETTLAKPAALPGSPPKTLTDLSKQVEQRNAPAEEESPGELISQEDKAMLNWMLDECHIDAKEFDAILRGFGVKDIGDLTPSQGEELRKNLDKRMPKDSN